MESPVQDVRGGRRRDQSTPGRVLKIVSTDPPSVRDYQALMKTATKYELVRQEEGWDDRGRRTFTHVLRRKAWHPGVHFARPSP